MKIAFFTLAGIAGLLTVVALVSRNPEVAASRPKVVGFGIVVTSILLLLARL